MARRRHIAVVTLTAAMSGMAVPIASAADGWGGQTGDTNVRVNLFRTDLERIASQQLPGSDGPKFEYGLASVCGQLEPGADGSDNLCGASFIACSETNPEVGAGPAMFVWRRTAAANGSPASQWESLGVTCLPQMVPGASPALTMAMIQRAFRDTDFTKPRVNIQPEGDVTLVNLPTFFEVQFPEAGFGPDEVDRPDPATLLGHEVEIRPRLESITYHLGERTVGPTTDLGGPYPDGTVVQTYTRPGEQQVRADIVYSGQFRVGGSGWIDIPGTVELQGTPVTLTVREAKARLYSN